MASQEITKPKFNEFNIGSPKTAETSVTQLIAEGARTYLNGISNGRRAGELANLANINIDSGEYLMKLGGSILCQTFELTEGDAAMVVEMAVMQTDVLPPVAGLRSIVACKMATGFIDNDHSDLAADLFDSSITHPNVQEDMMKYLLARDPNITQSF